MAKILCLSYVLFSLESVEPGLIFFSDSFCCLIVSFSCAFLMHATYDYAGTYADQSDRYLSLQKEHGGEDDLPRLRPGEGGCLAEDMWGAGRTGSKYRCSLNKSGVCIHWCRLVDSYHQRRAWNIFSRYVAKSIFPTDIKHLDLSFGSVSWPHNQVSLHTGLWHKKAMAVQPQLTRQVTLATSRVQEILKFYL